MDPGHCDHSSPVSTHPDDDRQRTESLGYAHCFTAEPYSMHTAGQEIPTRNDPKGPARGAAATRGEEGGTPYCAAAVRHPQSDAGRHETTRGPEPDPHAAAGQGGRHSVNPIPESNPSTRQRPGCQTATPDRASARRFTPLDRAPHPTPDSYFSVPFLPAVAARRRPSPRSELGR